MHAAGRQSLETETPNTADFVLLIYGHGEVPDAARRDMHGSCNRVLRQRVSHIKPVYLCVGDERLNVAPSPVGIELELPSPPRPAVHR